MTTTFYYVFSSYFWIFSLSNHVMKIGQFFSFLLSFPLFLVHMFIISVSCFVAWLELPAQYWKWLSLTCFQFRRSFRIHCNLLITLDIGLFMQFIRFNNFNYIHVFWVLKINVYYFLHWYNIVFSFCLSMWWVIFVSFKTALPPHNKPHLVIWLFGLLNCIQTCNPL